MSVIAWAATAASLSAAGLLGWLWMRASRAAAHTRARIAAWAAFVETAPEPPPRDAGVHESVFPLCPPPGPSGEVAVWPEGLILRLARHPDREVWVPWADVMRFEPAPSGVDVRFVNGLRIHVSIMAERALYRAKAVGVRAKSSAAV